MIKIILISMFAFISIAAQAQPETTGNVGPILIQASTLGTYTFDNTWVVDVRWQGSATPILEAGIVCGLQIPTDSVCLDERSDANLPLTLSRRCGDIKRNTGFPHSDYEFSIVVDGDHGRISCNNYPGAISSHIEFT